VGSALQLKSTPELQFAEDDVTGGVARVQALLDEMARRDAAKPKDA
jgi:ribosome-binding factor A